MYLVRPCQRAVLGGSQLEEPLPSSASPLYFPLRPPPPSDGSKRSRSVCRAFFGSGAPDAVFSTWIRSLGDERDIFFFLSRSLLGFWRGGGHLDNVCLLSRYQGMAFLDL